MTSAIYKIATGVPCRACGAVLAPASGNAFGLCQNCWNSVLVYAGHSYDMRRADPSKSGISDQLVNSWLAHKLVKDLSRMKRDGMVGRCEALSGWSYGSPGAQCAKHATEYRDGHPVCNRHARATDPSYVGDPTDPYLMLKAIISELADADARFAEIVAEVAKPH